MYLYLGQDKVVRYREIIGIFDLDNTTVSKITREMLRKAEQNGDAVTIPGVEIPQEGIPVRFLVAEAYYSEQVVVAFLVFDQERQAFVSGRILLCRTGRIDIDMAPQHRLDGREPLFLALLVQGLPAFLEFQDTKHRAMIRQRDSRSVIGRCGSKNII